MTTSKEFCEHTWDIVYDSGAVLGSFWGTHEQAQDYAERNFPGFSELRMQPDSFDGKEDGSCCTPKETKV